VDKHAFGVTEYTSAIFRIPVEIRERVQVMGPVEGFQAGAVGGLIHDLRTPFNAVSAGLRAGIDVPLLTIMRENHSLPQGAYAAITPKVLADRARANRQR
jgi:hypothetical protein